MEKDIKPKQNIIPADAKCVFKGEIFDVYQWQQKVYDGTFQTYEALKRPDTAVVIPIVDGKLLIQIQEQPSVKSPFYSFPGGRIEKYETHLEAAKRELLEESGYSSDEWSLLSNFSPVSKINWEVSIFLAKNCKKLQDQDLDPGEKITNQFVTFEELLDLLNNTDLGERSFSKFFLELRYDKSAQEDFKKLLS